MSETERPSAHEVMSPLLETLAREVPDGQRALVSFYRDSLEAGDWSAEEGVRLASKIRESPREQWNSLPEFVTLGRLVLSVTSLFLWKLKKTEDHELAWRMVRAGDESLRRLIASDDYGDGSRLPSVASWGVREAVQQVLVESRTAPSS